MISFVVMDFILLFFSYHSILTLFSEYKFLIHSAGTRPWLVLACFYRSMLDGWGPIRSTSGREQKGSKDDAEKIIRELNLQTE